jgi:hypothetical protein
VSSNLGDALEKLLSIRASTQVAGAANGSGHLWQLLKELHPPKELPGLYQVVRHTIPLLDSALTSMGPDEHEREMIRTYLVELLWLRQNLRQISKKLFDDREKRERMLRRWGKNPVLGELATKHGLWCLLWHDHPDPLMAPVFKLLQSDAVAAHRAVLRYRSDREDWIPGNKLYRSLLRSLYEETSEIRKFVRAKYRTAYDPILHQLAAQKVSPQDLASALRRIAAKHAPQEKEARTPLFSSLCSMLWLFRREQHPDRVRSVSHVSVKEILGPDAEAEPVVEEPGDNQLTSTPMDGESEESDDLNAEDDQTESERAAADFEKVIVVQWTPEQLQTCCDLALHPSEVLPLSHAYLSRRKSGPRGRASWRARENQLLHWGLDSPPLELVADALEALHLAAKAGDKVGFETFTLAMAILRTSLTMADATRIVVCPSRPKDEDVKSITLVLRTDPTLLSEWVFPALPISYRGEPITFDGCRRPVDAFPLADFTGVGHLIRRLLDIQCGGSWDGRVMQPFAREEKEYKGSLRELLARDGSQERQLLASYCTFERLSMVRFYRIFELAGENVVPATYCSCREHDTGEVPRYYETVPVRAIQSLDRKSMIDIFAVLRSLGFDWHIDESLQPSDSEGYLGSPYCPTLEALKLYLAGLRGDIANANQQWKETGDPALLIEQHNLYVTYTQLGYLIGTCHRAVGSAYSDLDHLDRRTRFFTIQDKGQRARQAPACDILWTQMLALRDYLKGLSHEEFAPHPPELPIFLLSPDRSVVEIRPATLQIPWPMNFGRHFVRSEFVEAILNGDCPVTIEQLKELLGHAAEGEERDGACSDFNYHGYSLAMRGAMDLLLRKIEYWPIDPVGQKIRVLDSAYDTP